MLPACIKIKIKINFNLCLHVNEMSVTIFTNGIPHIVALKCRVKSQIVAAIYSNSVLINTRKD